MYTRPNLVITKAEQWCMLFGINGKKYCVNRKVAWTRCAVLFGDLKEIVFPTYLPYVPFINKLHLWFTLKNCSVGSNNFLRPTNSKSPNFFSLYTTLPTCTTDATTDLGLVISTSYKSLPQILIKPVSSLLPTYELRACDHFSRKRFKLTDVKLLTVSTMT